MGTGSENIPFLLRGASAKINLKAAVEREKAVQAIDVPRELNNCVVTLWVMSQLFNV